MFFVLVVIGALIQFHIRDQLPKLIEKLEGLAEVASYKIPVATGYVHTMPLYI